MPAPSSSRDPDQQMDAVIQQLREQPIPAFADPEIHWPSTTATPDAQESVLDRPASWSGTARARMKRRLALAASIILFAALAGVASFPWSHELRAFAQVQSALGEVDEVSFRVQTYHGDELVSTYTVSYKRPHFIRADGAGDYHIINGQAEQTLDVDLARRSAQVRPIYDFDSIQHRVMGGYAQLLNGQPAKVHDMTDKMLDGRGVRELRIQWDGANALLLVDAETHRPIRLEADRGSGDDGKAIRDVLDQFQFDPQLDDSLFAIQAPEGYRVDVVQRQSRRENAEPLILSHRQGIGPVRFGMTRKEVTALLGPPDAVDSRPGVEFIVDGDFPILTPGRSNVRTVPANPPYTIDNMIYDSQGFRITVSSKDGVRSIQAFGQHTKGPGSRKFLGKTAEGVEIGDSWDKVKQTYGDPASELDGVALHYRDPSYHFDFREGELISIRVTAPPARDK